MASFQTSSIALKLKPFRKNVAEIIAELSDRRVLEGEFLLDPAGFMAARLHGTAANNIARSKLNGANRFLFSIMSNEKFLSWINDYQDQSLKAFEADPYAVIDKDRLRLDLAKAMIEFGDAEIIASLLPSNLRPSFGDDPVVDFDVIGNISGKALQLTHVMSSNVTQVQAIIGGPNPAADVAVEIETLIYAVAAVAVFAVAVAAVVVGARTKFSDRAVFRDVFVDMREMSNIAENLVRMGNELRSRGRL